MKRMIRTAVVAVALLLGTVTPAAAQTRFSISVEKRGRARHVDVNLGFGRGPVLHHRRGHLHTDCCRRWVPPHCDTITERVWVEPRCERVWVPPAFELVREACGRTRRVCIRAGYWNTTHHPGRFECVTRTVHVPGKWEIVCGH